MDVPQRPCKVLLYSTRLIDWAYQRVNQCWSAKVRNGSDLEKQEEEEQGEQWIESQWWTYPSVLAPAQCTRRVESTEPTSESIGVDLQKIERGQLCRRRRRRRRRMIRAANWESIMDVPQHPCKVMVYSTSWIDRANQRVNRSWSGKVRKRFTLETGETVKRWIESYWSMYPSVIAPSWCTRRAESTEPSSKSIRADLKMFERGLPWRLQKQ